MNTKINSRKHSASGFTLIELMIVVAIIAILATIVYPSYTRSVLKSRRTEARTVLLDLAGREERRFSTMSRYSAVPTDLQYTGSAATFALASGFYSITITATDTTFSITATATGAQAADAECATFTVDQTGAQSSTGGGTKCW